MSETLSVDSLIAELAADNEAANKMILAWLTQLDLKTDEVARKQRQEAASVMELVGARVNFLIAIKNYGYAGDTLQQIGAHFPNYEPMREHLSLRPPVTA